MKKYPLHITNHFNSSHSTKKRIIMLYNTRSAKARLLKFLALLPVLLIGFGMLSCSHNVIPEPSKTPKITYTKLPKGYTFLKEINAPKGTNQQEFTLTTGNVYTFRIDGDANKTKTEIILYNSNKKTIAKSLIKGKYYPGLGYKCSASGTYTMEIKSEATPPGIILAYKKP